MRSRDTNNNMKYLALVLIITWVEAQDYNYEDLHNPRYSIHFKQIPKRFEIKGNGEGNEDFQKYYKEIESIAKHDNISVVYKIKLEIVKPTKLVKRKNVGKRLKSKKYNIPLKKNSMKLSNFEVMLRKMAEQSSHANAPNLENIYNPSVTTKPDKKILTTKQVQLKFKPIISKVKKTNYIKVIRPVRNRVITLTV